MKDNFSVDDKCKGNLCNNEDTYLTKFIKGLLKLNMRFDNPT